MYDWIVYQGFHPILVATKLDKIKRSQVSKQVKLIKDTLQVEPGIQILPFSAQTMQGREEIWAVMDQLVLPEEETGQELYEA